MENQMKRHLIAALPLALLLTPSTLPARVFRYHGTVCQPVAAAESCVQYSRYGVQNDCTTAVTVECPLPISSSGAPTNLTNATFYAYDRHGTQDVTCTIQQTDLSGAVLYSVLGSTNGGGPGTSEQYWFTDPAQTLSGYWRMRCSIPAANSGAISHLTYLSLSTNE